MLRYQKRAFAFYIALCVVIPLACGLAAGHWPAEAKLIADIGTVAIIAAAVVCFVWPRIKINKVIKRYNDCHVEDIIWFFDLEFNSTRNPKVRRMAALNLAAGLHSKGRFKEAVSVELAAGPLPSVSLRSNIFNIVYFNNLGVSYAALGEVEAAEECLDRVNQCAAMVNGNQKTAEKISRTVANLTRAILLAKNDFETALPLHLNGAPVSNTLLAKVAHQYGLARCYENLGEPQKAKECYEFVAQNGGDTYYAATAKEKLAAKPE